MNIIDKLVQKGFIPIDSQFVRTRAKRSPDGLVVSEHRWDPFGGPTRRNYVVRPSGREEGISVREILGTDTFVVFGGITRDTPLKRLLDIVGQIATGGHGW